jgi:hypothetical protein
MELNKSPSESNLGRDLLNLGLNQVALGLGDFKSCSATHVQAFPLVEEGLFPLTTGNFRRQDKAAGPFDFNQGATHFKFHLLTLVS